MKVLHLVPIYELNKVSFRILVRGGRGGIVMYSRIVGKGGNYQHVKHADARGGLGACPPRKFLKNGCYD